MMMQNLAPIIIALLVAIIAKLSKKQEHVIDESDDSQDINRWDQGKEDAKFLAYLGTGLVVVTYIAHIIIHGIK